MTLVVLEHTHDVAHGVYRLVVAEVEVHDFTVIGDDGQPVMEEVVVTDSDGNPVTEPAHVRDERGEPVRDGSGGPLVDEDGRPILDAEGRPVLDGTGAYIYTQVETKVLQPVTRRESVIVAQEDFVFADDDEQWKGKAAAAIAAEQRQIVKDALGERDRRVEEQMRERARRRTLPGVGNEL